MKKKRIISMALALFLVTALSPNVTVNANTQPIRIAYGAPDWENSDFGSNIFVPNYDTVRYFELTDVQPEIINGRVFVPIRPISENMSWNLTWDEDTSTATIISHRGGGNIEHAQTSTELILRPGYASVTRRNNHTGQVTFTATPEVLPQIVDGRFMVPMRTLEYALFEGDVLVWDENTRTVYILGVAG